MTPITDGYLPFRKYKTYYKIFGEPDKDQAPLLVLHGGPGGAHNYLLGLAALAKTGRQVIFYDQIGSGRSDHPMDNSLWSVQLFLDELTAVRRHLKLDRIHLLGHSWGGMLTIEYLLTQPAGIESAVLASAMIDMPLYQAEVEKLKADLPPTTYAALKQHESAGTTESAEYNQAYTEYKHRHIFRAGKFPEKYHSPDDDPNPSYTKLWGANEAFANGTLKNWTKTAQLKDIHVPVLITSGQYDELTPHQALITHANIPGSQIRIFTAGSHLAHIEREAEYLAAVSTFLG